MMRPDAILAMCQAWHEMNVIHARDGVPYNQLGHKSDVSLDYWEAIMASLDRIVKEETGHGCHCHPFLYRKKGAAMTPDFARRGLDTLDSIAAQKWTKEDLRQLHTLVRIALSYDEAQLFPVSELEQSKFIERWGIGAIRMGNFVVIKHP